MKTRVRTNQNNENTGYGEIERLWNARRKKTRTPFYQFSAIEVRVSSFFKLALLHVKMAEKPIDRRLSEDTLWKWYGEP
jgi:hypothetical protein